jgi:hypothetical protein
MSGSGHSIGNPRVLSESGIEAVFILNVDPDDRKARLERKDLEFIWRPMYGHLGRKTEVLGHVFYDFYTSPLDLLVLDRKPTFDPTDNHTVPNKTDPVGPPPS